MSRIDEIKLQLELWDNRIPLEPTAGRHAEILYDTVRMKAEIFNKESIEHIRFLLSKLDTAVKALEDIIFETDVPVSDIAAIRRLSTEALQQLRS